MSSSYDINTAFDALDDSLVSDVIDLDSWASSLSPHVASDEPVHHPATRSRQKRSPRSRGHPRPTPSVGIPPATRSVPAPPVLSTPVVASSSTQSGASGKVDKGKGREPTTTPAPTASPVDSPFPPSVNLTPEQHVCIMRMLKRLDEWLSRGWEPGVDKLRLQHLAEIFNSAEAVASGGIDNIRQADLAWKLADSKEWESSAASSIMGAIDIQVTVTRIVYKDYGDALINSFRSFLGWKEAEVGDGGCPCFVAGPPISTATPNRNSEPVIPKRVRFQDVDGPNGGACTVRSERDERGGLLVDAPDSRIPSYDEACKTLTQHLAFVGAASYGRWRDFLFSLRESLAGTNALRSEHACSPLPNSPFIPLHTHAELRYLLAGRGATTDAHPLGSYRCFRCNSLGHWSSDHDRYCGNVYGGPPHSGVLPDLTR